MGPMPGIALFIRGNDSSSIVYKAIGLRSPWRPYSATAATAAIATQNEGLMKTSSVMASQQLRRRS